LYHSENLFMPSCIVRVCLLLFPFLCHAGEAQKVDTPRGATIEIIEDAPAGNGPFPLLILAPGQAFPMTMPLMEQVSHALVANGVAVIRFNWAFYTQDAKRGSPSGDLSAEVEDMQAVLDFAKAQARFDRQRIAAGGKSLGSLVTWKVLRAQPDLKAGLLLTPICGNSSASSAASNYPGLENEIRPLAFIMGDSDPLCASSNLYRFAADARSPVRVAVIGGDHAFRAHAADQAVAAKQSARNTELAAQLAADFVAQALKRN
jgi:hypothetical protein